MSSQSSQKLSLPIESLIEKDETWINDKELNISRSSNFDLIIIGSGYGGAVAAARFAGATESDKPLKIAVFERGREILPGDFPNTFAQLPGELRIQNYDNDKLTGDAMSLFDLRLGKTVNVLLGNGLGGGSLINAAVVEEPHSDIWNDPSWPQTLREESTKSIYFERARKQLAATRIDSWDSCLPDKLTSMKKLSDKIGENRYRTVNIAIDGQQCIGCGDCITGCNVNAKNTLPKTYLAQAKKNGASLYTGATVSHLERIQQIDTQGNSQLYWLVFFVLTSGKSHSSQQQMWVVKTKHVILSAGAIGSTEILQRSQAMNSELQFSKVLGQGFSCNGDMIWNGYNQSDIVNAIADPAQAIADRKVGPTIASMIDLRNEAVPHVIQDASVPAALKRLFEELVTTNAVAYRMIKRDKEQRHFHQDVDAVDPQKIRRTAIYLSMGKDSANGQINFIHKTPKTNTGIQGRSEINWGLEDENTLQREEDTDNVCNDRVYSSCEGSLQSVTKLGGTLLPNPAFRITPKKLLDQLSGKRGLNSTITVHPLGGCRMGDDVQRAVVNHFGAVFSPQSHKGSVYEGLYVLDGSIIPCSIGINPLLTISALSERAVTHIADAESWILQTNQKDEAQISPGLTIPQAKHAITEPIASEKTSFSFQEIMNWDGKDPIQKAYFENAGISGIEKAKLIVKFHIGDQHLSEFLRDPQRIVKIDHAYLEISRIKNSTQNQTSTQQIPLQGQVRWLWETPEDNDTKERHGFAQYFRSRARADLRNRTDVSPLLKFFLDIGIKISNRYNYVPPNWLIRTIGTFKEEVNDLLTLASHTGGHRLLHYDLKNNAENLHLIGFKDVNYGDGSNLWRSLGELKVRLNYQNKQVEGLKFCLDWNRIFEDNSFQIDANKQGTPRNPDVWLDLFSIFSFWVRSLVRIHFWSFRLPEVQIQPRNPHLPTSNNSTWHPITLTDSHQQQIQIGLTHFPAKKVNADLPPVLMIHGFGASGLQFAAPGRQISMAEHFQNQNRDVWVADLRTSIALNRDLPDKLAQWSLDEVAQNDLPALVHYVLEKTEFKQIDILAHCIGSAMFNIAVLSGRLMQEDRKTSLIRSAALMQVGPIFTVSENNKLRGYFAYFVGKGMEVDFIDSSTDRNSEDANNTLIDRVLSTYPVPISELHCDEPEKSLSPVFPDNQWLANYYRSSGVFGRLFDIQQLSVEMLNQLGDLLGRTNFKTFQQIIQSVMRNRLVDIDGRNCYVNADNFRQFYNFPTRFFYGEENDVFDRWGIINSVKQLRSAHGWSESLDGLDQSSPYSYQFFPEFGHLDPIIGINSASKVYPALSDFLKNRHTFFPPVNDLESLYLRQPNYGPIVGWTRKVDGKWTSRVWLSARETAGNALYAAVYRRNNKNNEISDLKLFPIQNLFGFQYINIDLHLNSPSESIHFSCLHRHSQAGSGLHFAELVCENFDRLQQEHEQTRPKPTRNNDIGTPTPQEAISDVAYFDHSFQTSLEKTIEAKINASLPKAKAELIKNSVIASPKIIERPDNISRVALGSCRYSGTMLEQVRNNAPYAELLNCLDNTNSPELMLLMGDQVYVDATASVADTSDKASILSLYHRSLARTFNNEALSAAQVFSRLPAYMMLDDHEIRDNWNSSDDADSPNKQALTEMSIAAFLAYQWSHGARNPVWQNVNQYWSSFSSGNIDFFMIDTRMERTALAPMSDARIINDEQFNAIELWLSSTRDSGRLRLLISPSQIHNMEDAHILRSDSWSAYPHSLKKLCDLLAQEEHVGILCGDQHLHGVYSLDYHDENKVSVRQIPVIVASPLYAPYPFANPRDDLPFGSSHTINRAANGNLIHYRIVATNSNYQGFSQLRIENREQHWQGQLYQVDGTTPLFPEIGIIPF